MEDISKGLLTQWVKRFSKGYVKTRPNDEAPRAMLYGFSCSRMPSPNSS